MTIKHPPHILIKWVKQLNSYLMEIFIYQIKIGIIIILITYKIIFMLKLKNVELLLVKEVLLNICLMILF
jgi:hypothetical protein